MSSLEDALVTVIDTNWSTDNYTPKPTIDNILDYDSNKDIPEESITIIPFFQTVLIAEAQGWREEEQVCECWIQSVTGKTNVEDMFTEMRRVLDNYTITSYWKLYVSDIENKSDKSQSPKRYWIICNINARKEESY